MLQRRRITLVVPLLVLVFASVACRKQAADDSGVATAANPANPGGVTPRAGATRDLMAEMRRWAQCIRSNGYDVPDPDPVEGKFTFDNPAKGTPEEARFEKAREACQQYDTFSEYREPMKEAELQAWIAYAQCMRKEGVPVSDPDPAKGLGPLVPRDLQRNQTALVEKARNACQDKALAARAARHQ